MKKVNGRDADEHYMRMDTETGEFWSLLPEYCSSSNRPGIGAAWFKKYGQTDLYSKDFVTIDGTKYKAPRYYDKLLRNDDERQLQHIKNARRLSGVANSDDNTMVRLRGRQRCHERRITQLERSI